MDNVYKSEVTCPRLSQTVDDNYPQILIQWMKDADRALKECASCGMLSYPRNTRMVKKE